jgi:sigma-B regulation protein RsbU (phosphoserine phosphatase)
MPRALVRYAVLAILMVCACWVRGAGAWTMLSILRNPGAAPDSPLPIKGATRTIGGPDLNGDQILAIDGKPFSSARQFDEAVYRRHPGDKIRLTLSRPDGSAFEKEIVIPSMESKFDSFGKIAVDLGGDILVPLVALFLGAFAVAVRPTDRNAWILLFLMITFTELTSGDFGLDSGFASFWHGLWGDLWPFFMMLFGIYFPDRSKFDREWPWAKYTVLIPCLVADLSFIAILLTWTFDIDAALPFRPLFVKLYFAQTFLGMLAISTYFANIAHKAKQDPSADARRRLRILVWGSCISLTPIFLIAVYSLARGYDLFYGVPAAFVVVTLLFLTLFPLTLAYVIVVERAMDLRFVIRQSVQYGLVKGGLWVARALLIALAVYLFTTAKWSGNGGPIQPIELTSVGIGLLVLRRRTASRASQWVDRRFFRESYDAEKVLTELASQVGRYVQIQPLLETVAARVSNTLHTPDIVILLRDGDNFIARYSTRPGQPMNIAVDGNIAKTLRDRGEAVEIYFDKPALWLRSLTAEELQTLDYMRTQILLPLTANENLTGIVSLGPKLSEAPYTETDIRLLQAIASQMGLAVENSRLVTSLAAEAAAREIANRELEIAREVQERLFPQTYPAIAGLDCAGYCRPARGVGGDYYDFLLLDDGRLGIAIGDVSGKGIAAALLMASLQASLRGQAAAGVHDLSSLMHNVNKLVYEASTSNRYATFFYGEYDAVTRKFSFVNAGHNPPLILRGDEVLRLEADGPVVGLLAGARYGQSECCLQPGDVFIAFTDGISEALNEQEEEWEEERFIPAAQHCRQMPAKDMIQSIFRAADAFTGNAKQYDDMTLLVMKLA